jgi:hypothetical protein
MYGPSLPATGGGISAGILIWGLSSANFLVVAFAILGLISVTYGFFRLRHGENNM